MYVFELKGAGKVLAPIITKTLSLAVGGGGKNLSLIINIYYVCLFVFL